MTAPGISTGSAQVDARLHARLVGYGVPDYEAREIARAYVGTDPDRFIEGLECLARILLQPTTPADFTLLVEPWPDVCQRAQAEQSTGKTRDEALLNALGTIGDDMLELALMGAVSTAQNTVAGAAHQPTTNAPPLSGTPTTAKQAAAVTATAQLMTPPDPALVQALQQQLNTGKGPKDQRRKRAAELLTNWLIGHGKFVQTPLGQLYYLYRTPDGGQLYALDSNRWKAFLYVLTDCNPKSGDFAYLQAHCEAVVIRHGEAIEVVRLAHWDAESMVLRVSRFDGQVYRLDGEKIELEANGDGPALFEDNMAWSPYEPVYGADGAVLNWTLNEIPHWDGDAAQLSVLHRAWWLATFFSELVPTRPILTMLGEKGSGKSMAVRVLMKMLFGMASNLSGVPDKPDAFTTLASNHHIVALDNFDELKREMRDKLAGISTGMTDTVRELYTTNTARQIAYRSWLVVTSRTPETLQRDDLVDRIVLLPLQRIADTERSREAKFIVEAMARRNIWWGDLLTSLNAIVREIGEHGLPDRAGLRMEDWAALGEVIARIESQEQAWAAALDDLRQRRDQFLIEDHPIVQAMTAWMAPGPAKLGVPQVRQFSFHTNLGKRLTTRDLYKLLKDALFDPGDRPDASWPRSIHSFGKQLSGIQREIAAHLLKQSPPVRMTYKRSAGYQWYQFDEVP